MIDWTKVFAPDVPVLELVVRGSAVYVSLFLMLRVVLKRQSGTLGMTDLLVIVLIADAAQNGMAGTYNSVAGAIILVATIIFWSFALDWLGYHVPWLEQFVSPPPLPLIRDGKLLRKNMRRELITDEELMGMLRQKGLEDASQVKLALMEGDGEISVIRRDDSPPPPTKPRRE